MRLDGEELGKRTSPLYCKNIDEDLVLKLKEFALTRYGDWKHLSDALNYILRQFFEGEKAEEEFRKVKVSFLIDIELVSKLKDFTIEKYGSLTQLNKTINFILSWFFKHYKE